jgi:chromosome segregation ATPase
MARSADPEQVEQLKSQLEQATLDLEELQGRYDREAAEGKRIRAESITLRDRIEELKRSVQDREDMLASHGRVAEELREELKQTRDELANVRAEVAESKEHVAAKERQLERAQGDLVRIKEELEDLNRQLAEVSRTKDEGWKKLNDQLGEIEHLREVINEQERMLEERRVGLVSQEEVIKELRNDKEKLIKQAASVRAERDELRTDAGRQGAQLAAVDEENRRLSEMLAQMQTAAATGNAGDVDSTVKLAEELKHARVEVRKLESDKERLQEVYERAEREIAKLESRVAELEVDLRDADERREVAKSSRGVAEEAMAKAEARAHKAEEEAIEASKARDVAMSSADDARREADRLKRDLERVKAGETSSQPVEELENEILGLREKLREAIDRANDANRQLSSLMAERDAAQVDAQKYKTGAFVIDAPEDEVTDKGADVEANLSAIAKGEAIAKRATEVYEEINDILSELRNNIVVADGEFGDLSGSFEGQAGDSVRIIKEALEALVGNAEDAKGVLRGLKELVEFDA